MAIIKKAKNITIKVNKDYTLIAGTITETADKITVTATKGNLTLSSNKKVVIQGFNGGVSYGHYTRDEFEKKIIKIEWLDAQLTQQINTASIGDFVGIKLQTKNYNFGEIVTIKIKEKEKFDIKIGEKELTYFGTVDKEGFVKLQELLTIESV